MLIRLVVIASLAVTACKDKAAPPSPDAGPPRHEAKTSKQLPVLGTNVTIVRCELGPLTSKARSEAKLDAIGTTRHLHLAPDGALYFFPDQHPPARLEPVADGCGYRMAAPLVETSGKAFALEPDGSIAEYSLTGAGPKQRCRIRALDNLRNGRGRLQKGRLFYRDAARVMVMDLTKDDCEATEHTFAALAERDGGMPWFSAVEFGSSGDDLLVALSKPDWKNSQEVFRIDPAGKLVQRVGAAEGPAQIDGDLSGCGDGYCSTSVYGSIDLHDRQGRKVSSLSLGKMTGLRSMSLTGLVDVPDKGVYAVVGYHDESGGRPELVRLDGIR